MNCFSSTYVKVLQNHVKKQQNKGLPQMKWEKAFIVK